MRHRVEDCLLICWRTKKREVTRNELTAAGDCGGGADLALWHWHQFDSIYIGVYVICILAHYMAWGLV